MTITGARIMAIGDSITYGFGDATVIANGAWRFHLADPLAAYLRTTLAWRGTMQALGAYKSGQRMLGTSGRRIDEVLNTDGAAAAFLLQPVDIGVCHLGTNDMTQTNSGTWVGGSVNVSIANMSTLMDNFRTANPYGIFVVCKIMPSNTAGVDALVTQWNSALATMVAARSDSAYIIIADVNTAFKNNATWSTDYMYDSTHPNDAGEQVIASAIYSAIVANVTRPVRVLSQRRRSLGISFTSSLRYNVSTATDLGASTMLDSTKPWAVSMDINIGRDPWLTTQSNGILALKTDQATPFVFLTLPSIGGGGRGFEFGSSANFGRFFPKNAVEANIFQKIRSGWHQIVLTFDGVDRTAATSYKLDIDGINIAVTSGSGLSATTNVNQIGRVISGGRAGIFNMADLTIWNGGTVMTRAQVEEWYFAGTAPTGPTMTHRWRHTNASGSTLTDSVGSANGAIGTATWSGTSLPVLPRQSSTSRSIANPRTLAS